MHTQINLQPHALAARLRELAAAFGATPLGDDASAPDAAALAAALARARDGGEDGTSAAAGAAADAWLCLGDLDAACAVAGAAAISVRGR